MKKYIDTNKEIHAIEEDGSQDFLIQPDWTSVTETEIETIELEKEKEAFNALSPEDKKKIFEAQIQAYIDSIAQSVGYDNISSIGKYLGYDNPFRTECEKLGLFNANTWIAAYTIYNDVIAGVRPMPTIEQVITELPAWVA